ncbi:MAG TPA: nucleotidyltransferase substrate binding protein [Candidatus Onthocola gallistercoris]|uniref:Nucleotidyltransferase substrate binding protein n=1 Tax=Candidatus Onthocola gallistercoris TaxID=2840876 RepID=A0A9D1HHP3_9FIRM|nr:nucleotidyltransferase substrate binding protein [Candidatus Onthocola gallistercoris]
MRKYENFCAALTNLKDIFLYSEPYDNVVMTGLVGLYEICFEQSWKAMKEVMEENGLADFRTGSPKSILKTAYQAGMIKDEALWLQALAARNNVAHACNKGVAQDIVRQTKDQFYQMFLDLKREIDDHWM